MPKFLSKISYINDSSEEVTIESASNYEASVAATHDTVPLRDGNGRFKVETPSADKDATNKKYVDDKDSSLDGKINSLNFSSYDDTSFINGITQEQGRITSVSRSALSGVVLTGSYDQEIKGTKSFDSIQMQGNINPKSYDVLDIGSSGRIFHNVYAHFLHGTADSAKDYVNEGTIKSKFDDVETRLTNLGFKKGDALISAASGSVTTGTILRRQGNYIIGRLIITWENTAGAAMYPDQGRTFATFPSNFRPKQSSINLAFYGHTAASGANQTVYRCSGIITLDSSGELVLQENGWQKLPIRSTGSMQGYFATTFGYEAPPLLELPILHVDHVSLSSEYRCYFKIPTSQGTPIGAQWDTVSATNVTLSFSYSDTNYYALIIYSGPEGSGPTEDDTLCISYTPYVPGS